MNLSAALAGMLIVSGLLKVGTSAKRTRRPAQPKAEKARSPRRIPPNLRIVASTAVLGLLVFVGSGWWAVGLLMMGAGVLIPAMRNERAGQVADRQRLSALASWVESIRDLLAAAAGIEEAVTRSAESLTLDSPIRREVWDLRAATETLGLREALRRFGEQFCDPISDYIAASLLVASERPSSAVHHQLTEAAANARESVSIRERVEAARSRMWTTATTIAAISILMVVFVIGTQPSYSAWYGTIRGQIILLLCGAVELFGMWSMARMARPNVGHRVVLFDAPTAPTARPSEHPVQSSWPSSRFVGLR